jgi:hypothetical protein
VTTQEIRELVVDCIVTFAEGLPLHQRPTRKLSRSKIKNATPLCDLGITYSHRYKLGLYLARRGRCRHLHHTCTGHWRTIEDVVTSVIAHPIPYRSPTTTRD